MQIDNIQYLSHSLKNYFLNIIVISSICAICLFFVKPEIDYPITFWQLCSCSITILFTLIGIKLDIKKNLILIFIFQILLSFLLFIYFIEVTGTTFGYEAVDSLKYDSIAKLTSDGNWNDLVKELDKYKFGLPDYGFPIFLRFIYSISPNPNSARIILLIINCFFQLFTCYYILKILKILEISQIESKWIISFWGYNIVSVYLNVSGLKEPLFLLICTITLYSLLNYCKTRDFRNLLLFFCFTTLTWFFRNYMTAFYILIFLGTVIFKKIFNNFFSLVVISAIIFGVFLQNLLIYVFPEIYFSILGTEENLPNGLTRLIYYGISFIGPIPRFFNTKYFIVLIGTATYIIKYYYSIFAIIGSYYFIKYKFLKFYPIIILTLLTILMLIVSGHLTEFRYLYPVAPCFYILMICGFKYCKNFIKIPYIVLCTFLLILFDIQG